MEKKKLSLVFFVYLDKDKTYILMGKQAPSKRLAGIRIGFGGKCEGNESMQECAIREVLEEAGIVLTSEDLQEVGKIVDKKMEVGVFIKVSDTKFVPPSDSDEFVDIKWFELNKPELFVHDMLPNNNILIDQLTKKVSEMRQLGKITNTFIIDETNLSNKELELQKAKIGL